ncbi:MAG: hypothetical protein BMS9Abin22_601 [Gammaproteobacteria bacterium]|nr:MAG: hypothetical protein BMS9Abin22_601 [Gammaproteobacteria bacterium]
MPWHKKGGLATAFEHKLQIIASACSLPCFRLTSLWHVRCRGYPSLLASLPFIELYLKFRKNQDFTLNLGVCFV